MALFLQWIDLIWLPITFAIVRKKQRLWALIFVISCMCMMRLQTELLISINKNSGVIGLLEMDSLHRGIIFYSCVYALYLISLHYSRRLHGHFLIGLSASLFVTVFVLSTIIMAL